MKRYKLIMLLLIAMTLITACDNVYYSAVSGHVEDANNKGIGGVNVYAYRSQSERDAKFNSYEVGKPFDDPSCLFRATTAANGDFSIGKVVWKTSKSEWGKDYASTTLYLIFFSEEYGIQKSDGINIISGSANSSSITVNMGNSKMSTDTLNINFKDSKNNRNIDDAVLDFTYSYNNGYRDIEENASVSNGVFSIQIRHLKDNENPTVVTVSNIKNAVDDDKEVWTLSDGQATECTLKSATNTLNIKMDRKMWDLGDGISGKAETEIDPAKVPLTLNGATVKGTFEYDGKNFEDTVYLSSDDKVDEFNKKHTGTFSGLFKDTKVAVAPDTELTINITITASDGEGSGEVTINKDTGKQNPITIIVKRPGA